MDLEKIKGKIQKLLAKADSTDSPQEAENLLVKANEYMIKYKVSQFDMDELNQVDNDTIETNQIEYGKVSLEGKWELELMYSICRHQGCKHTWRSYSKKLTVYGSKEDVEITMYFFERARTIFRNVSRKAYNEEKRSILDEYKEMTDEIGLTTSKNRLKWLQKQGFISYRSVYVRSFLYGAAGGLNYKLKSMIQEVLKESEHKEKYALMRTNQLEKIENHVAEFVKPKTVSNQGAYGDQKARGKGIEAGKNHNLTVGIGTNSNGNKGKLLN